MSQLMEILGRAMTVDTADLIWHWLSAVKLFKDSCTNQQNQQLDKITKLIRDMKTDAAAEQLRLYLFENPACIKGRLAAAAMHLSKCQLHKAIEELNSVYLRQPNNTMALYALGHCYERLGREDQAVEFYQDCLKFKNHLQLPRQRLAAVYFKNGQLEKTTAEYELLKDEYPDDILTLVLLGHLYITTAEYDRAVEIFNTAILIHPDNFNSEDDHTNQLIADGRLHEAVEQLDDLLGEQPERADLILKRADVLGMLGAADEAVAQYEKALSIHPDFLEATVKLGTQYLQMHQQRLAARQFNRAMEINDRIVDAYIGLAIASKLAGSTQEALTALSLATAIGANSSLLFAEAAILQFKADFEKNLPFSDEEDHTAMFEAVIKAHRQQAVSRPQNPDLHYRLGILMMSVGRMSDAISAFQAALQINPAFTRAANKLAICLFETEQKDLALQQLISPDCLNKDTLLLHYKVALLYCDRIKFASSLINLEHYMNNNFACADTAINISIVLQNLGLLDRATAMWDNLTHTTTQAINTDYLFPSDDF